MFWRTRRRCSAINCHLQKLLLALDIAVSAIQADCTLGAGYAYAAAAMYRIGFEDTDIYADDTLANALPWARRGTEIEPLSPEAGDADRDQLFLR